MCGIAGFISTRPHPAAVIWNMCDIIRHRGPDDEGFVLFKSPSAEPLVAGGTDTPEQSWREGIPYSPKVRREQASNGAVRIAFGHRRLSIIDLSPLGHQPMNYMAGRYWITYNGEIYNFTELRCELESLGHSFLSQSDTEVILAAYAQWGADCLHRFNGMWAFAIYDAERQEIFLARDRFGVKPLYYWAAPNGAFFFASEIKQFTVCPGWVARVNPQRAYDFLVRSLADHTDETLFAGVFQVPPGHALRLPVDAWHSDANGRLAFKKWYDLKSEAFSGTFTDAAAEFRRRLKDSVNLRLRADVPVGSCLSGGLDSSSIVCLINRILHDQGAKPLQTTFSACADVKRFDERYWIDQIVRMTAVDAHYVYPTLQNLFGELPAITWHQDEPFGSTSIYAQWNVFRLAAQNHVKVMLDGQGADEQLAGYHGYFGARFADLIRQGRLLRLWREVKKTKNIHGYSEIQSLSGLASMIIPQSIKTYLKSLTGKETPSWLNLEILGASDGNSFENFAGIGRSLQTLSYEQLTSTSIPILLHYEDRDSMAHSVESRVPFLDFRLVEFLMGLPDEMKLSDGITKRALREAMSGVLPDSIRDRMDKLGFVTPEEVWIKETAPDMFRLKLRNAVDSSQGILSPKCLDMLEEMISGDTVFSFLIWRMISFGEWMETFSVKKS